MIIVCIYHHPIMNTTKFIKICISKSLQKISKKDKTTMLMGD